jgi:predicted RNase H-like HicB family nuclease
MKDNYIFPAVFSVESDGVSVEFPDLPGCLTCGDTEEEALFMAKDALHLHTQRSLPVMATGVSIKL